jgi:hypothetical protein
MRKMRGHEPPALIDRLVECAYLMREWVGPDFAPEKFDLDLVNRELRGAGTAAWRRKRERFYAQ